MEEIKIKKWIGYGYGDGDVTGSGCGYGYGSGCGSGCGYGSGSGYGYGFGYGDGFGDGDGSGYGDGIKKVNKHNVYKIDGINTCIDRIKDSIAKGFVLNKDLTQTPCYIVKGNGYFAHGKTIKEAQQALVEKYMENMDEEEIIEKFMSEFEPNKKYKGSVFFNWHHYLTGSCLMGRESFVKNHDLNLDDEFTVDEFIELTVNDYGGSVINKLKESWERSDTE